MSNFNKASNEDNTQNLREEIEELKEKRDILKDSLKNGSQKTALQKLSPYLVLVSSILVSFLYLSKWLVE